MWHLPQSETTSPSRMRWRVRSSRRCSRTFGSRLRRYSKASARWGSGWSGWLESWRHFYERSEPWWRAYEREPDLISAWSGGVDQYYADIERLMRAALGELSADERSVAVVASVIGPPTFFALRARGLSSDEAVELSLELVLPWLEHRRDTAG